jgi:hypothetical protein
MLNAKIRIARPVTNLSVTERMYCGAFELSVLSRFNDHEGFDGIMLGTPGQSYHFEFTVCHAHPVQPTSTEEDLIVFYLPATTEWEATCDRALQYGFNRVPSLNPYWDVQGQTFQDTDRYSIVLQNASWPK